MSWDEHVWEDDGGAIAPPSLSNVQHGETCGVWDGTDGHCTCGASELTRTEIVRVLNTGSVETALAELTTMCQIQDCYNHGYMAGGQDNDLSIEGGN